MGSTSSTSSDGGGGGGTSVTGGDGTVTFTGLTPGCHYDVTATDPCPGTNPATGSLRAACVNNPTMSLILGPDDNHACCESSSAPVIPVTLTLTGPGGTTSVTIVSGSGLACIYRGCINLGTTNVNGMWVRSEDGSVQCGELQPTTDNVAAVFTISIIDGSITGSVVYNCCNFFDTLYPIVGVCGDPPSGGTLVPNVGQCNLGVSGTLSRCPANGTFTVSGALIPMLNGTWTLTE